MRMRPNLQLLQRLLASGVFHSGRLLRRFSSAACFLARTSVAQRETLVRVQTCRHVAYSFGNQMFFVGATWAQNPWGEPPHSALRMRPARG